MADPHTGRPFRRQRIYFLAANPYCWLNYPGCTHQADTIDLIVPQSLGGRHDTSNWAPACKHCNSSRGNKPPNVTRRPSRAW
jgi:5-methylcytosine-specific restriction endonuclease McrA